MQITITNQKLEDVSCQVAIIFVFQRDGKAVFPKEARDLPQEALKDFSGAKNASMLVYRSGQCAKRTMLVGLGERKKFTQEVFARALGAAAMQLQKKKLTKYAIILPVGTRRGVFLRALKAIALAQYQFADFKDKKSVLPTCQELAFAQVLAKDKRKVQKEAEEGLIISECINKTRRYGDMPPSEATPSYLAGEASRIARENKNVKVKILGKAAMQKLKMNGILAVSRGSRQEPRLIVLEYQGAAKSQQPIAFVGKGITYDTGGINIKPPAVGMLEEMKSDMSGGGAVLGLIEAAARLRLKKNIVGIVPSCENMLGDNAFKPGDILRLASGKTAEIVNTDAEGRPVLADALHYARSFRPKAIIDYATLTGSCLVALGYHNAGFFSRDKRLCKLLESSAQTSGEKIWRLPLGDDYLEEVQSDVADLRNVGKAKFGDACNAAAFLEQFVPGERWAHLDIAPTAFNPRPRAWMRAGATGTGVHLGIELAKKM